MRVSCYVIIDLFCDLTSLYENANEAFVFGARFNFSVPSQGACMRGTGGQDPHFASRLPF